MRRLGAELGVQAMSLYKHVPNKDRLLDEIVEEIFGGIEVTGVDAGWQEAMRRRAHTTRDALRAHPWAIGLLESRGATGPAATRYVDAVLGCLRSAGFSVEDAVHAFWTLDSFVYGHVLQEARTTGRPDGPPTGEAAPPVAADLSDHPHLAEVAARASEFSVDDEFRYGLELILAALAPRSPGPAA
jgi:AcrR family transcriptional regulator